MHAEDGVHARLPPQGKMRLGTKAPIGHQDITGGQLRMESDHCGEIMGAQGGGPYWSDQPGTRMKQRQQVRNGEPPPWELFAGLAKMLLQCGGIGHGNTRAIDPKGAMAPPTPLLERFVVQSVAHGAEQPFEHREREPPARLTIGGSRHVELGEMT
jgi:hypothetical protein